MHLQDGVEVDGRKFWFVTSKEFASDECEDKEVKYFVGQCEVTPGIFSEQYPFEYKDSGEEEVKPHDFLRSRISELLKRGVRDVLIADGLHISYFDRCVHYSPMLPNSDWIESH